MKTLTFAKPLVLVLVGLPGSGKSFFARQFAEMFDTPLVSHDKLRYELFANPQFIAEEYDIIDRLTHYLVGELLKTKRSFLIDGGSSTKAERQALSLLAKKHGYDVLYIWVQIDDTTARQRSMHRNPRRVDDQYSPHLTEAQFVGLVKRHVVPNRESHVVISGKHAFSTQAKTVLRRLTTPHTQEAAVAHEQERTPERPIITPARPDTTQRRSLIIS
jgi:predicted kinase